MPDGLQRLTPIQLLKPSESLVLAWMSGRSLDYLGKTRLTPCELDTLAAQRVGWVGVGSLIAVAFAMSSPVNWLPISHVGRNPIPMGIALYPVLSICIGLLLLLLIHWNTKVATPIVMLLCYYVWPISMGLIIFTPIAALVCLPLGFNMGIAMLVLQGRWSRQKESTPKRLWQGRIERLVCLALPAIATYYLVSSKFATTFEVTFFPALAFVLALIIYSSGWHMIRHLSALRHVDDKDAFRTSLVVMSCIWLWLLWATVNWKGWSITGGPSRP